MKYVLLLPMLLLALLIGGCSSSDDDDETPTNGNGLPDPVYYTVNTSADAPDMNSIDAVWDGVGSVVLPAGKYPAVIARDPQLGGVDLVVKAIVKSGVLYLYTQWPDADADLKHYYIYKNASGVDFSKYVNRGEDKIYVMFDNGQNGTEKADCASMCHLSSVTKHFTAGGNVDVWVWKSSTTYPAFVAEDSWWDEDGILTDYPSDLVRYPLYRKNFPATENFYPYFHHTSGPAFAGPFLYFDDTTSFSPGTDPALYEVGDTIPAFAIDSAYHDTATVLDSRWEVLTYAEHAGGKWTVVFARELNTGNADDDLDLDEAGIDTLQVSIGLNDNHPYNSENAHSCTFPFYMIIP